MTLASQWKSGFDDSEAETDHEAAEQGLQSPEHRKQVCDYPLPSPWLCESERTMVDPADWSVMYVCLWEAGDACCECYATYFVCR